MCAKSGPMRNIHVAQEAYSIVVPAGEQHGRSLRNKALAVWGDFVRSDASMTRRQVSPRSGIFIEQLIGADVPP